MKVSRRRQVRAVRPRCVEGGRLRRDLRARRVGRHTRRGDQEDAGAGAGRAVDPGYRRDDGCRRALADRPRRRRRQHHRRGRRLEARHLRLELSREEFRRGRRIDDGIDPGARSAHSRQRRGAARRQLEQEGIFEGEGPDGPDARACSASATSAAKWPSARARSACRSLVWSRRFTADAGSARRGAG